MEVLQEDQVLFGHNVLVDHAGGRCYIIIQAASTIKQADLQQQTMGNACNNEWSRCVRGNLGWATGQSGHLPGVGGPSATSCGGGCCYGYPGAAGLVRITYDQD